MATEGDFSRLADEVSIRRGVVGEETRQGGGGGGGDEKCEGGNRKSEGEDGDRWESGHGGLEEGGGFEKM